MIIESALNNYVASLAKTWDRSKTVGASEIGQCARKTWYTKHTSDPTKQSARWGAFIRGKIIEEAFWYPALKAKYGDKLKFAGPDQQTFTQGHLSATPDGLIVDGYSSILVECKTIDPRSSLTEARFENRYQVQVQMGIVQDETQYKPTQAHISYIDASFWDDVKEYVVKFEPAIYTAAHKRATMIMTAEYAHDLHPEGWIAGGRECEYCPFVSPCGVVRRNVPEKNNLADPQLVEEIKWMCTTLKLLENRRNTADADWRQQQQAIKDRLREKSLRTIPGVVTWSSVKGRTTYDVAALKTAAEEAGVNVEQFVKDHDPTDRLVVHVEKSNRPPEEEV
jgi:hypothetical protein